MHKNILANKYSYALFNAISSKVEQQAVLEDLKKLNEIFENSPTILKDLSAPMFNKQILQPILDAIMTKLKINKLVRNFIYVLVVNKRLNLISDIYDAFIKLDMDSNNEMKFIIRSAVKMSKKHVEEIKQSLENITKKKVVIEEKIDANIIGGFTIQYGSILIENTMSSKLKQIKAIVANELENFELGQLKL